MLPFLLLRMQKEYNGGRSRLFSSLPTVQDSFSLLPIFFWFANFLQPPTKGADGRSTRRDTVREKRGAKTGSQVSSAIVRRQSGWEEKGLPPKNPKNGPHFVSVPSPCKPPLEAKEEEEEGRKEEEVSGNENVQFPSLSSKPPPPPP